MNRSTIGKPADRDEWLELRRPFFNASSAAVLFDRHPFQSAADYATTKLTGEEQADTSAMRRGRHLEESVAQWWAEENGVAVYEPDVLYVAGPIMCTVDRWLYTGREGPVEIKTATGHHDEPEQYWLDQCQAIMLCCDSDVIDLVWLDASLTLKHQVVDADEAFQGELLDRAERFMAAIELGIVPDWVSGQLNAGHVIKLHPDPEGDVELDAEVAALVEQYVVLRDEKKHVEEAMESCRSQVAVALGEHEVGTFKGQPIISFKATKPARRIDTKAMEADHPDLVEQYVTTRPGSRRFVPSL